MVNWTDKIIHWNQLPGTEVRRLVATWGMTPEQIAKYDKKHGFAVATPAPHFSNTDNPIDFPAPAAKRAPAKKATAKKVETAPAPAKRQKHTGVDGEVRFLEHRDLWIGFAGGRVVVTKRTREGCKKVLQTQFGLQIAE